MNALSPVLLNNQTLQAVLSCFPRDRVDSGSELPFGGYGRSALGRKLGHGAVADDTEEKTFHVYDGPRMSRWLPRI